MSGTRVRPEINVGIPIVRPENVAVPPKCSAYELEDETTMKNDI